MDTMLNNRVARRQPKSRLNAGSFGASDLPPPS